LVSSFQNTLKKETNLNMYTGMCQNRHILFFLHKALTFSSQGFLFSKVFVICCAAKGLPDSNNPFYDSFSSPLLLPLPSSTPLLPTRVMLRTPPLTDLAHAITRFYGFVRIIVEEMRQKLQRKGGNKKV